MRLTGHQEDENWLWRSTGDSLEGTNSKPQFLNSKQAPMTQI